MTPKDAALLASKALEGYAWHVDGPSPIARVANAILAACAEERKAALAEAADLFRYGTRERILALRDREPR